MTKADAIFKSKIRDILNYGTWDENPRPKYKDSTPAHTKFITQEYEKYDLSNNEFPITTLRPIAWKSAIKEMLWIYKHKTSDLSVLEDNYGVTYWRDWELGNTNTIGEVYGKTVNNYNLIDNLLEGLKNNPFGRRHIMSLWQEEDFKKDHILLPCAYLTMWSVRKVNDEKYLDCTLIQRS